MDVDSLWVELALSLGVLKRALVAFFPRAVAALFVLLVTTLVAWGLRAVVRRVFRGFAGRLPGADIPGRWGEVDGEAAARAVASAVFWLLLLGGVMVASEALGMGVLGRWLGALANYIPNVVLAVVIGFGGVVAGRLAGAAIGRASVRWAPHQAQQLARLVQFALGLVALLVAASQLGIDVSLLTAVFLILFASTLGGVALAFGLGARSVVGNILAMHYVNKSYGIGQLVRVGEHEGRIVRTNATSVFLEHEDGEIAIPGSEFAERRCIRLVPAHGA
ncbi:MAG: mechanosensitive ion channel domain-containing protein [Deltaproteobacteria bacterium]